MQKLRRMFDEYSARRNDAVNALATQCMRGEGIEYSIPTPIADAELSLDVPRFFSIVPADDLSHGFHAPEAPPSAPEAKPDQRAEAALLGDGANYSPKPGTPSPLLFGEKFGCTGVANEQLFGSLANFKRQDRAYYWIQNLINDLIKDVVADTSFDRLSRQLDDCMARSNLRDRYRDREAIYGTSSMAGPDEIAVATAAEKCQEDLGYVRQVNVLQAAAVERISPTLRAQLDDWIAARDQVMQRVSELLGSTRTKAPGS